ncbi:hypothetical protein GVY41_14925 [Frigidibacter albus]|uniref:DUF2332 family protein n=1 Tax=Frigidibacter albus TaxID=1465486 RepID=A0A6L8VIF4_9RHOB|nr:hypothetical protein [Frigidibacter albus]MZQ90208.1 hypothetical protein [Frigidibacter albus]NBE32294.1 hypothetical protein [Frigidibacter albus]GGH58141.1 hypothetical protein GCM10011341_28240 [Frigidibacter albus]
MSWCAAFAAQARACAGLGSPFTVRLLQGFADHGMPEGAVARRITDWPGNICSAALLAEADARATPQPPLARFGMEADGAAPGAGLTLTLWPGGTPQPMDRFDFHGCWIDWQPPAQGESR